MTEFDDLMRVVRSRRSVRRYEDRPVDRDVVARLLESASWAPSAGNRQDWSFVVVSSPDVKQRMADAAREAWRAILDRIQGQPLAEEIERYSATFHWFAAAPVVIVVAARRTASFMAHLLGEDAGDASGAKTSAAMAAQNLMLAAQALGLGTCCMTGALAARKEMARVLGLPARQEIVCLIALGYPAEEPAPPPRKPVDDIARFVE